MAIFLPGAAEDQALALDEMTPREIVAELDKYVVGQQAAHLAMRYDRLHDARKRKAEDQRPQDFPPHGERHAQGLKQRVDHRHCLIGTPA